jgi:PAS domain S-box-containing protein
MATQRPTSTTRKAGVRKKTLPLTTRSADSSFEPSEALSPYAFFELAPDGIIVADSAGRIRHVNHQTEVLFGYDRTELVGSAVETLLPPRLSTIHEQHRARYVAAPHTRPMGTNLDLSGLRKDGSEFPVEVSLSPLQTESELLVIAIVRDVTERTRIQHERIEQAERLRMQSELINAAHDAILVRDPSSRITAWNHGAEEVYGWTEEEVRGKVTNTLFQTRFPVSQAVTEAEFLQNGRWEGVLEHTRADGQRVLVESRHVLLRDQGGNPTAILEINRDITERTCLEEKARLASQRRLGLLQTVLDKLPGGAYLVQGPQARLMLANRAATEVWGTTWVEGMPMVEFLRESGVSYLTAEGQPLPLEQMITIQIVNGGPDVRQRREVVRRLDGTHLPILLSAVAIENELLGEDPTLGGERAAVVLLQDITELQAFEQIKDQFITVAAHELRTPLTAIMGFASMLTVQTRLGHGPELADWQQEAIDEIEEASGRMNTLVKDLLDVTRIQAGRLELNLAPLDLVATLRRCVARFQLSTDCHTLTVEAPEEPVLLDADGPRLEQVLGNLLGNAIKYSPDGGPITIKVQVDQESGWAKICIQDQGIGIPADQQPILFGRFVRASNVHEYHISGTGLGLYVCRELVERHGGHIWFESAEGAGTTFFITLPLLHPAREITTPAPTGT